LFYRSIGASEALITCEAKRLRIGLFAPRGGEKDAKDHSSSGIRQAMVAGEKEYGNR